VRERRGGRWGLQIELLHGDDLGVAPARCAALDAERGALRGLSDAGKDVFVLVGPQSLRETSWVKSANHWGGIPDGGGALALAQRRRSDACHDNIVAVLSVSQSLPDFEVDLSKIGHDCMSV
jgi:hypothetical protein